MISFRSSALRFAAKPKTLEYYENGVKSLLAFQKIADCRLDAITGETIGEFAGKRRNAGLEVSSVNRELQALRRMFRLAQEWGKVEKALPTVKMLPGEKHRERVLTAEEEDLYFRRLRGYGAARGPAALGRCSTHSAGLRSSPGGVLPAQAREHCGRQA